MQQKTVQIKKIIRWTFRQWEPMCDHLGGVWGWQDRRCQVHHGLHLQGDVDDEDIDDGDEKWEKLKDSKIILVEHHDRTKHLLKDAFDNYDDVD